MRIVGFGLALFAASCGIASVFGSGEEEQRLAFSHRIHADEGLECGDCHLGVDSSDDAGMPGLAGCRLCHDESEDEEKPPEQRIASLFDESGEGHPRYTTLSDEVIFSHLGHVEAELECSACHGDISQTDAVSPEVAVTMAECMDCHAQQPAASNECTTCHTEYAKDIPPYTHEHGWMRIHGKTVRARSDALVDDCTLCHTEQTCVTCHRDVQPESHNNYFRLRGHGAFASMDRQSCLACHRADFCVRCHNETRPISHVGSWGGTQSNHCLGCHLPLKSTNCVVCHKDTPSHQLAPPKPPDHVPSMNCRLCHGMGVSLPHADNGTDCNACHR